MDATCATGEALESYQWQQISFRIQLKNINKPTKSFHQVYFISYSPLLSERFRVSHKPMSDTAVTNLSHLTSQLSARILLEGIYNNTG